jgi:hypothetical protein
VPAFRQFIQRGDDFGKSFGVDTSRRKKIAPPVRERLQRPPRLPGGVERECE